MLTITDNADSFLDYYEELRIQNNLPGLVKKNYRQRYLNAKKLKKQSDMAKGRVQNLLQAAFVEEIKQFFEFNEDQFLAASPSFAGFGNRLLQYVKDHSHKKAVIITSRVHPGEP